MHKAHSPLPVTSEHELKYDEKPILRLGWLLVLIGFGGFMLWATLAPLDKGVSVTGNVVVTGNRKTIQHQNGGIIERILVHDGDRVQAGQVLLMLNATEARSEHDTLLRQYQQLLANEARLLAQLHNEQKLSVTPGLEEQLPLSGMSEIVRLQQQLLDSQQRVLQLELSGIQENMTGLSEMLSAQQQAVRSERTQKAMLDDKLKGLRNLAKKGYVSQHTLLEMEHQYAEVEGNIARTTGEINRIQHQILEQKLLMEQRQQAWQKEVSTQLSEVQVNLDNVNARLTRARFQLANMEIRAPVPGTVVGMSVFTEGGVISGGQKLMEVVPDDQPLLVDARIPVQLVDQVRVGLAVELQFIAFNQSTTPRVEGQVVLVSADRLLNEQTGEPYYLLQIQVIDDEKRKTLQGLTIKPGMPVECFIRTGERSLLNYLFKPLLDRLYMSLNEE